MKVRNMTSVRRSGAQVPNQFIIEGENGEEFFQSYKTTIARRDGNGRLTLDENALDYSRTTSLYLYKFTGQNRDALRRGIADGSIEVDDLNR